MTAREFLFDAEKHLYTLDGKPIPSVTTIMTGSGLIDTAFYDDLSRDRGVKAHYATELFDKGSLDFDSLDPILYPFVEGWVKFRRDTGFVPDIIERKVYNLKYWYAGTLDRTGFIGRKKFLLDIKTGTAHPATALQTSAYEHCLDSKFNRCAVQLTKEGGYKFIPYKKRDDFKMFRSCIDVYNLRKRYGVIK